MSVLNNAEIKIPFPQNEPVLSYAPGSPERQKLKASLEELKAKQIEIPLIIGGKEIRTGNTAKIACPHDHTIQLGTSHKAGPKEVQMAIDAAMAAKPVWQSLRWEERAAIFLKAADLLAGPYRFLINAATMLNISKNPFQAEIDAACELIDFLRFNVYFAQEVYSDQPLHSPSPIWNYVQHRPLEGFVFAVAPFNFTAIAGNLPTAPAIMGNTVVWKPASSAVYAPYHFMKLLQEAGLPDGVINFVPGSGSDVGNVCLDSPDFNGIHFTGSTAVFQSMWKQIGNNIAANKYKTYPRIVGETGGKDFIFAHSSANVKALATGIVRGAFEYQGQKCSAASRAYIPETLWAPVMEEIKAQTDRIKMGDVADFGNFVNAVIDKAAFSTITQYIDYAAAADNAEIVIGGHYDDSKGFFVEPTVITTTDPHFKTMEEEIFGPVMTMYCYKDEDYEATLELCDQTSPYSLTGAVFAQDRLAVNLALGKLENASGNFYINDKPTGAVVGQQPFGGGRASGTNDKAGSKQNLMRWASVRAIKENFVPPQSFEYPFLDAE
ncbi:L-glutamate gamma-semialdehyde dehydrogenase [uncultured Desulfuromusa sp.]|uniref:L-glutamate gamma-semialdehyde dehydrogenase n=1 Tax=uncultured Desulfuromusa sp. TaxID=219183 RepID=UPI002AA6804B|nr:L-glutamate gamma-semialdehyde dehydrogenase [uncultured Desulfuromusa sp.]